MSQLVSIVHVAGQGWSSAWIADGLNKRPGYERLHELIDYATNRLGAESLEDPAFATFECIVNGPEAMAWLDENRPDCGRRNPEQARQRVSVRLSQPVLELEANLAEVR